MSKLRGLAAARRVQKKAKDRKGSGGPTWSFMLKSGEDALTRFRGLLRAPTLPDNLDSMDIEDLVEIQTDLQGQYKEDMTQEELLAAIKSRAEDIEPAVWARHYVSRNQGKRGIGLEPMVNCGDSEVALDGNIRENGTSCRVCTARLAGDEGVGWPGATFGYTLYDYRRTHRIQHSDNSKEYVPCTQDEKDYCKHCEWNEEHDDKDKKHRKLFHNGIRVAEWGSSVAQLAEACERRIRKLCRSCAKGKLKATGAYCPHANCGEELPWKKILKAGWNPDDPEAAVIECPHCGNDIEPEQEYECTKCDDPKPARLCDVDVLIGKTGEGRQAAWTFTEQLPLRPLDPEDEDDAKILAMPFPDYEDHTKAPSVAEQLKQLAYQDDPLGETRVPGDTETPRVKAGKRKKDAGKLGGGKKKKGSPFGGKKRKAV